MASQRRFPRKKSLTTSRVHYFSHYKLVKAFMLEIIGPILPRARALNLGTMKIPYTTLKAIHQKNTTLMIRIKIAIYSCC